MISFISGHSKQVLESQILEAGENSVIQTVTDIGKIVAVAEQSCSILAQNMEQEGVGFDNCADLLKSMLISMHEKNRIFYGGSITFLPKNKMEKYPSDMFYGHFSLSGSDSFILERIGGKEYPYLEKEWFCEPLKRRNIYWSEPYLDEGAGNILMTTCSVPFRLKDSREYAGVVTVDIALYEMQQKIARASFMGSGNTLLLSRKGLYMVHPDPKICMKETIFSLADKIKRPELKETGIRLSHGETGVIRMKTSSVAQGSVIFFFAPVPGPHWGICLVFAQEKLFKPLDALGNMILVFSLCGLILLVLMVHGVCRHSMKSLENLTLAAQEYGNGNFSALLPKMESNDEIGKLTKAFQKMRDSLIVYIQQAENDAAEMQKRKSELEVAHTIQLSALPTDFPQSDLFHLYAGMFTAKEVGGDFYDYFMIDENNLAMVVADVSGKGITAALFMMSAKTLIKNLAKSKLTPQEVLARANYELCQNNRANMFLTVFLCIMNTKTGELAFANGGHNPPLVKRSGGQWEYLAVKRALVIGAFENSKYHNEKLQLIAGDKIFIYTDGVTEAQNKSLEFYGEKHLRDFLNAFDAAPKIIVEKMKAELDEFSLETEQADDITILVFEYHPVVAL